MAAILGMVVILDMVAILDMVVILGKVDMELLVNKDYISLLLEDTPHNPALPVAQTDSYNP
jgi:hypothetical protein